MGEAQARTKLAKEAEAALRDKFEAEIRRIDQKVLFLQRYADDDVEPYRGRYKRDGIQCMWEGYKLGHAAGYEEGVEDTKPKFE